MPNPDSQIGVDVVLPPPPGSSAVDTNYSITTELLASLSPSAQSSILSVSNIGASTLSRVCKILELVNNVSALEAYLLDGTVLDNLQNNSASSVFTVPFVGSSRFVRVVIILGELSPKQNALVKLKHDATIYELAISQTTSEKRLEFNNIPASFVSSFTVENHTGHPFASSGNSIVVVGL